MNKLTVVVLLAAGTLGGCATCHELAAPMTLAGSGLINDPAQVSRLEKAMTDEDIADLLDVDVRAKLPTAVAIARLASACSGYQPALATIDAEELTGWEKAVAGREHVRGVHPVTPLSHGGGTPSLHSLRVAAAKLNCELLLVYLQSDRAVDNFNEAAVLYWTVLGLWLVPGSVCEHRTVMQAVLLDCRTGMILGTATGDCHLKKAYPAAFQDVQEGRLSRKAPAEALADLQKGFERLLARTVQAALAKRG